MRNHTHRPNVKKFYAGWIAYIKNHSREEAYQLLKNRKITHINNKDRIGLMQALGFVPIDNQ